MQTKPFIALALFIFSAIISFAQIKGKVVGISDGDTFTLLTASNTQIKIYVRGNDSPKEEVWFESHPLTECVWKKL